MQLLNAVCLQLAGQKLRKVDTRLLRVVSGFPKDQQQVFGSRSIPHRYGKPLEHPIYAPFFGGKSQFLAQLFKAR